MGSAGQKKKRAEAEVSEVSEGEGTASAIGGVEENAERDATRSAIASSWLHTSGGRRRTHRARQADARGEVGDGLHGLEVRGVHGDGAAAAPAASERAPRRHARGHRGVQLTVATGDRARDVGWRARASGDRGRASRGAMRDGLHRVTNHSSVEGTRDVDRTNASNGGCARQPAASGISRSVVLVIKIAILRVIWPAGDLAGGKSSAGLRTRNHPAADRSEREASAKLFGARLFYTSTKRKV